MELLEKIKIAEVKRPFDVYLINAL